MTYDELTDRLTATYPNATVDFRTGAVFIPWGSTDSDGPMIGISDDIGDDEHAGEFLVCVYATLDDPQTTTWCATADAAWELCEALTELQPEGTDWVAWASHYVTEILRDRDCPDHFVGAETLTCKACGWNAATNAYNG